MKWIEIAKQPPPIGKLVNTKIHDEKGERNIQQLKFQSNLWWAGNMYVYYTPTHWAPL